MSGWGLVERKLKVGSSIVPSVAAMMLAISPLWKLQVLLLATVYRETVVNKARILQFPRRLK